MSPNEEQEHPLMEIARLLHRYPREFECFINTEEPEALAILISLN
jgi:hypothetical protein